MEKQDQVRVANPKHLYFMHLSFVRLVAGENPQVRYGLHFK